jgi:hypothetical protein
MDFFQVVPEFTVIDCEQQWLCEYRLVDLLQEEIFSLVIGNFIGMIDQPAG